MLESPVREKSSSMCSPFRSIRPICRSAAAVTALPPSSRRPPARNASGGCARSVRESWVLKPGDLVINLQRENWAQARRVREADAIPIPPGLDLLQAAMLRINPPTAMLLLDDHVTLQPGDCVIQNVANSAVGRHLIVLAKARGVRTINVVRRDDVARELRALGADAVIQDASDLPDGARGRGRRADPARHRRVSGEATQRIADSVSDGAVVVNYGSLSGEDPVVGRAALTQRGVVLTGFILDEALRSAARSRCGRFMRISANACATASCRRRSIRPIRSSRSARR